MHYDIRCDKLVFTLKAGTKFSEYVLRNKTTSFQSGFFFGISAFTFQSEFLKAQFLMIDRLMNIEVMRECTHFMHAVYMRSLATNDECHLIF